MQARYSGRSWPMAGFDRRAELLGLQLVERDLLVGAQLEGGGLDLGGDAACGEPSMLMVSSLRRRR